MLGTSALDGTDVESPGGLSNNTNNNSNNSTGGNIPSDDHDCGTPVWGAIGKEG